MQLSSGHSGHESEIIDLFSATFTDLEGAEEGQIIADFVSDLMKTTRQGDLFVFLARKGRKLLGCIFFSRVTYRQDNRTVFILSPVAVRSHSQKQGIGQKLISYGLNQLRTAGVDIALTYGDPNYYSKVGFERISEQLAQAPLKLQHPHGWLGQVLSGQEFDPLIGPSRSVAALNKPDLW